jgi:hypothetical protein
MNPPTKLNGYNVLVAKHVLAQGSRVEGYMVLLVRDDENDDVMTAFWAPHMGSTWHQGHYGMTATEALADLAERAARG